MVRCFLFICEPHIATTQCGHTDCTEIQNKTTETSHAFGHQCRSVCRFAVKYHRPSSRNKKSDQLDHFFQCAKFDCVFNYLNQIVYEWKDGCVENKQASLGDQCLSTCTSLLPPYTPFYTAIAAVHSHKLDRNACVTVLGSKSHVHLRSPPVTPVLNFPSFHTEH